MFPKLGYKYYEDDENLRILLYGHYRIAYLIIDENNIDILRSFSWLFRYSKVLMKENWQEQLKDLLNCDLKTLYPLARSMNRKLEFYVGPTNSGKTYNAMKKLKEANSGLYLAPLRLLALEGYEDLKESNIDASLITGEEQILNEDAAHICSTIEMLDFDLEVDVAIIDEVQMLEDIDRGWAWVNAIIGVPAKKVIMTGSVNALEAVKKIVQYLDEELEVVRHKRKNPLLVLPKMDTT